MIDWAVISFINPTDEGFRTKVVLAGSADEAVQLSGEGFAIAVPTVQRRKVIITVSDCENRIEILKQLKTLDAAVGPSPSPIRPRLASHMR